MIKQFALQRGLVLVLFMLPVMAWSSEAPKQEMSKDEWLKQIKAVVSRPICKGFMEDESIAARFKELNMTFDQCVEKIPPITDKCQKKYYDKLPEKLNKTNAAKWGRLIGECIGADFAINYLYNENDSSKKN